MRLCAELGLGQDPAYLVTIAEDVVYPLDLGLEPEDLLDGACCHASGVCGEKRHVLELERRPEQQREVDARPLGRVERAPLASAPRGLAVGDDERALRRTVLGEQLAARVGRVDGVVVLDDDAVVGHVVLDARRGKYGRCGAQAVAPPRHALDVVALGLERADRLPYGVARHPQIGGKLASGDEASLVRLEALQHPVFCRRIHGGHCTRSNLGRGLPIVEQPARGCR